MNFSLKSINKKYIFKGLGVLIVLITLGYYVIDSIQKVKALRNSVVVVATIDNIEHTRGATYIDVNYYYKGKLVNNSFGTYNIDSLKIKTKIRLKVSKSYPEKYIEYIGLYTPDDTN